MSNHSSVSERLFDIIDEMAMLLVSEINMRYLDALIASSQNVLSADVLQEVDVDTEIKLFALTKELNQLEFSVEEVRKALQLALLKGLKADNLSLDEMTPDGVSYIIGFLVKHLINNKRDIKVADFMVGTGNLLTAVLNIVQAENPQIYGVDTNYKRLELAKMLLDMQDYNGQFYNQSSIQDMNIPVLDLILGDFPMIDNSIKSADYLPYQMIENHLHYLKTGGYAIYIISNNFFSQPTAPQFHQTLSAKGKIRMLLQLPESMFKNNQIGKSILVVGDRSFDKEALIVALPNFNQQKNMESTLTKIEDWIKLNT